MGAITALRPDLDQNVDALPLYVTGALPNGKPGAAYEGRLQIVNPVGPCAVEQIAGDVLPSGASLRVDNDTKQVVLAWPAYSEYVTPLENPGFESGNVGGWSFTPKGGSAVPVIDSSRHYEGGYSLRWPGGRGMGSEGGIEVEAWNNTVAPCLPGRRVTIHARCMYNPDGHHFGSRYQGLIRFLDSTGSPIDTPSRGTQFKGRGNNGRWNDASATAIAPTGTKGVQMGAWLTGSEAPTWLDAVNWDVPSSIGMKMEITLNVTLRVRDSAGRTALWSGAIAVKYWDGTWSTHNRVPTTIYWYSVLYVEKWNVWVAYVDNSGYYSADGVSWILFDSSLDGGSSAVGDGLAYSPELDVLIATRRVSSPRAFGPGFTVLGNGTGTFPYIPGAVEWIPKLGAFAAYGQDGLSLSYNGLTWANQGALPTANANNQQSITWDKQNERFVFVSVNGSTYVSDKGAAWVTIGTHTLTSARTSKAVFYSEVLGCLIFIQQQSTGGIYTSRNGGATWVAMDTGSLPGIPGNSGSFAESVEYGIFIVFYGSYLAAYRAGVWSSTYVGVNGNCIGYSPTLGQFLAVASNIGGVNGLLISNS